MVVLMVSNSRGIPFSIVALKVKAVAKVSDNI
jgi:hypothetical protein